MSYVKKTWYYLQKNGIKAACLAVWERLEQRRQKPYVFEGASQDVLKKQRSTKVSDLCLSIVVPAYETKDEHLKALLDSVHQQTYSNWELIIADASRSDSVKNAAEAWKKEFPEDNIRYLKLSKNGGISENTNAGIQVAAGDYIGLLDHDDLLTPDALYEMVSAIEREKKRGKQPDVLYSDEDKCDGSASHFYEPHLKEDFNPDMLLSNNYICHFLVMKSGLMKQLLERPDYDGAQDYDLVLRAMAAGAHFCHVAKVLYHWRCHEDSTAANPRSKAYAYEAGKRAVEDFCKKQGWKVKVSHLKHLGFYRVDYEGSLFEQRKDIGILAGPLPGKRYFNSGIYEMDGSQRFEGLHKGFSGPMHRAALQQDIQTADLRSMQVREELKPLFAQAAEKMQKMDDSQLWIRESSRLCEQVRNLGYRILWDPEYGG